jgi:drug/metabolite transporter (DMT)-like permease
MNKLALKSNLLLSLAAVIWGTAFVAQRIGTQYLGAFTFNGVRFALGGLSLVPLILFLDMRPGNRENKGWENKELLISGFTVGLCLFTAASLQQIGMAETTAGKAAFITGLYIVLVPVLGIFLKHRTGITTWLGAIVASSGLYFLCMNESFSISRGDLFEIASSFFWAVHILLISHYSNKVDPLKLSLLQFFICSFLSLLAALFTEKITLVGLSQASIQILYGGVLSVGVAYTLQVIGQKNAAPSHTAIILSMETVFAALSGYIFLHEELSSRCITGCVLMFTGMILAQLKGFSKEH